MECYRPARRPEPPRMEQGARAGEAVLAPRPARLLPSPAPRRSLPGHAKSEFALQKKKKKTIKGREEPAAARREDASSPALRAVLLRARAQREGQAGLYAGGGARGIRATPQPPAGGPEWEQNERDCTFSGEIGSLEAFEPASAIEIERNGRIRVPARPRKPPKRTDPGCNTLLEGC